MMGVTGRGLQCYFSSGRTVAHPEGAYEARVHFLRRMVNGVDGLHCVVEDICRPYAELRRPQGQSKGGETLDAEVDTNA